MRKKRNKKTGGHRSYKKMGAVPKVRISDKTLFLSRSRTLKKSLQDMIVSLTQAMHLYMVCNKYYLKYGLSVHLNNKGRFKSQLYMQNTICFKSQTLK